VSVSHRSIGSVGGAQDPGRIWKGKKMPGHMGAEKVTTQNLKIVAVYPEDGLILVRGNIPGNAREWVIIHDAVKKTAHADAPKPAGLKASAQVVVIEAPAEQAPAEDVKE